MHAPLPAQEPVRDSARVRKDSAIVNIPIPPDTIPLDSAQRRKLARRDSLAARAKDDTLRAPLARAEMPPQLDIGSSYRWNRAELFATGALTLGELLDRIPGVTTYRSGWFSTPTTAAYMGEMRIRLFYDGLELDVLDERAGGVHDLVEVQLWTLEELVVERGATEIRVHMRSWRVDRTIASTRTDVYTGDEDTNIYRGYFGRRYHRGEALQLAAQQYSTESSRGGAGGDLLSLLGRFGWARRSWHADAYLLRTRRSRRLQNSEGDIDFINGLNATRTDAYVRAGFGNPDSPIWLQVVAGTSKNLASPDSGRIGSGVPGSGIPSPRLNLDSLRGRLLTPSNTHSRAQWVGTAGASLAGARLSLTGRYRVYEGRRLLSPSARASVDRKWVAATILAERVRSDSVPRSPRRGPSADTLRATDILDASVRITPLSFLSLAGAAGRRTERGAGIDSLTSNHYRGEIGVRVGSVWLSGGVMGRDTALLVAPRLFGNLYQPYREGRSVGQFAAVRGRIWKDIFADAQGSLWNQDTLRYRPKYQARSEVFVRTNWTRKFPSGNFGLLFSVRHDYRSNVRFPTSESTWVTSRQNRIISTLLEIRIVNAVVTWQYRNLLGDEFDQLPGFKMPRQVNLYGVRWDFSN